MVFVIRRPVTSLGAGIAALMTVVAAHAQMPPPPVGPEADEIRYCLCQKQAVDANFAEMSAKQRGLDELRAELANADGDLDRQRAAIDVNDPQAMARFRQLLERRDGLFRRTNGEVVADVAAAVARYNARVGDYNSRCADRVFSGTLTPQVRATLMCPPIP